jgi:hypothetical protein
VKHGYQGVCRGCGAPTTARGGKGDAYEFLQELLSRGDRADPHARLGARRDARMASAIREAPLVNRLVSSTDWSRTHARRRGGESLERFLADD